MGRRVVVTGAGVLCPLGVGRTEFWRRALEGAGTVEPIPSDWHRHYNYQSTLWAPLPHVDWTSHGLTRVECMQLDPVQRLALSAAAEAIDHAGLEQRTVDARKNTRALESVNSQRWGVWLGSGVGGMATYTQCAGNHILGPVKDAAAGAVEFPARFNRFAVPMTMPNGPAAAVSIKYGLHGPCVSSCAACASGTVAVGQAFRAIREGAVDGAISGGAEYLADPYGGIFRGFDVAGTLVRECDDPDTANRPFDQRRSGFLFAEGGAGVLVLEELKHARQRGATVLAEISGYAETCDAYTIMAVSPDTLQAERMVRDALACAGVEPPDIDYVNAHGTGTEGNDGAEAELLGRVFGNRPLVNSTKSLMGHTIGASGAIEAVVTVLSLQTGRVHPCRNLSEPVGDLRFVIGAAAETKIETALSYSFAFGGHNAGLVLRRP